jgi:hypothetical protein
MVSHEAVTSAEEDAPEDSTVQLVDELEPIVEEAAERGLSEEDILREADMTAEGGPPEEDTGTKTS